GQRPARALPVPKPHKPHATVRQEAGVQGRARRPHRHPLHRQNCPVLRRPGARRVHLRWPRQRRPPVSGERRRVCGEAGVQWVGVPGRAHRGRPLHARGVRLVHALGGAHGAGAGSVGRPLLHPVVRGERRVLLRQLRAARCAAAGRRGGQERAVRRVAGAGEVGVPVLRVPRRAVPGAHRPRARPQFADRDAGDWVLVNSFDELEFEVLDGLKHHFKARAIGPCVPLPAVDDSVDVDCFTYGANLLNPEDTCIKWLDAKSPRSVVYVSFGSNASIGAAQMEELARGLLATGKPFLWVVRAGEEAQLPRHLLDAATASGDALVVRWSPQLDVLAHRAVGCFVTHCGWNSTLEALGFGVPMVALPLWTDQPINARFIEEAWGAGVRARRDASAGVFPRGEIEQCVRAVMEDEDGRAAARRWSEAARAAVAPGGSSDQNLEEFVNYLRASAGEK
uniref:Glycosyltransferase n=1 Tax=Aegilops tauschii subsp. strangulata TaxID=200361 RepID=A0A453H4E5_AEGTS